MSSTPAFRTVLRGYEPAQVDQRTDELIAEIRGRRDEASRLRQEVERLRAELSERPVPEAVAPREPQAPTPSAFHELGARVGQILTLADEEAEELIARARDECAAMRSEAEASSRVRRSEADRYDSVVRGDARVEADRMVAAARAESEEMLEIAHRDAAVRREEAEALWEDHRARAAEAAAEFEVTLATRRERAQEDFHARASAAEHHLDSVERAAEHARAQSERELADSNEHVHQMVTDARAEADRLVGEARERAERLRGDSDRELAAATQRRTSINAQIASVRQMLASMSGSVPVIGFDATDDERAEAIEAAGLREIDGQLLLGDDADGRDHDGDHDGADARGAWEDADAGAEVGQDVYPAQGDDAEVEVDLREAAEDDGMVLDPADDRSVGARREP